MACPKNISKKSSGKRGRERLMRPIWGFWKVVEGTTVVLGTTSREGGNIQNPKARFRIGKGAGTDG